MKQFLAKAKSILKRKKEQEEEHQVKELAVGLEQQAKEQEQQENEESKEMLKLLSKRALLTDDFISETMLCKKCGKENKTFIGLLGSELIFFSLCSCEVLTPKFENNKKFSNFITYAKVPRSDIVSLSREPNRITPQSIQIFEQRLQ